MKYKVEVVITLDNDYIIDAHSDVEAQTKALELARDDFPDADFEIWQVGATGE